MSESVKRAAVVFATVLFAALSVCSFAAPFCGVAEGTASSSIVMDAASGRVLGGSGYNTRGYPASTTKILTALVVLERTEPECVVTVPDEAVGVEGSSIYLRKGEKLTVEDLLYGLMLRSGNDAAVALAVATAGSVERFAAMMNARAAMCGAKDSHFVNPHGLHDDDHYTTAYDMALIAAEAYSNPLFARIVSTSKITVGEGESTRCLYNKNKLLGMIDGANGVKTGYTKKSGRCLVGGAFRDGMQLVSVVLNIPRYVAGDDGIAGKRLRGIRGGARAFPAAGQCGGLDGGELHSGQARESFPRAVSGQAFGRENPSRPAHPVSKRRKSNACFWRARYV